MSDPSNPRPIGVEMNGYVWDGTNWVPQTDGAGHVFDGRSWRPAQAQGGGKQHQLRALPHLAGSEAFVDPHYSYGLTKQSSDDFQFIARFTKIMIIVWLVVVIPAIIFLVMTIGGLLASIGSIATRLPR